MRYESHTFNPVVFLCVHPVVADKSIRKCITINQAWHIIFFVFAFCRVPSALPLGAAQTRGPSGPLAGRGFYTLSCRYGLFK